MVEQESLVPWTDLPGKLLNQISKKLPLSDYLYFRLVCTTWREAAKQPRECVASPLLMLPHCKDPNARWFVCPLSGRHCKINRQEFNYQYQCFGSFHGWLLMMEGHSIDKLSYNLRNTIFLINPFTGVRIDLPSWHTNMYICNVLLSSAPTDPDCTVIIFYDNDRIRFCRVGDEEWTEEELDLSTVVNDVMLFNRKLYLLCYRKPVSIREYAINTSTTTHLKVEYLWLPPHLVSDDYIYLPQMVESGGEILLIMIRNGPKPQLPDRFLSSPRDGQVMVMQSPDGFIRDGQVMVMQSPDSFMRDGPEMKSDHSKFFRLPELKSTDFFLFRLDMSTSSWVEIKDIGNRVLFLECSSSQSFSAAELGCKENQIYFIHQAPLEDLDTWQVFDMEEGIIRRIEYGLSASDPSLQYGCQYQCAPVWVTPNFGQDIKQGVFAKL